MYGTTRSRASKRPVQQVKGDSARRIRDSLAVEEPLEIRLVFPHLPDPVPVAVTMRTPGDDFELAAGFLFTEGILSSAEDIHTITYCRDPKVDGDQQYNIVNVNLRPGVTLDQKQLQRNFYTSSSCGVCGKASLEAIHVKGVQPVSGTFQIGASVIHQLGDRLRQEQMIFEKTGGLHAAGWFDSAGNLLALREDVGRHNAVDKLLGHAFLSRKIPLSQSILMVSGRSSFEIMQKAAVAGVPMVTAVSAPSSLACDVAREFGITLVGFARGEQFNIYTGGHRILPDA
ncbi:MAG: formate dehydrogenase accessory sulfurtransferase FdhD [Firmicutes bacterium]|uniref:Sulfur carrier protein FdhD n=1 Tax=Melghirimyces thermohalophilus TaxID=1236220 RepID=A0A1G6N8B4_9BACL|nr:formate dehydrogenase accessory sulfurtransferase FdhD [Melghirimyces thermohalophilus]MDA8354405.1 formate dehydrogenase accessory sulfurtransferase FdhD [Bacillota bacterium]SDC63385.1 FdhD protein [Melghirimyces thermohalophilus]